MEDPPLVKRQRPLRSVCLQVNDDPNTSYYVEGQSVTRCTFNIADCVKVPQTSGALRGDRILSRHYEFTDESCGAHSLFVATAKKYPSNIAVEDLDGKTLTYEQLDMMSERVACHIRSYDSTHSPFNRDECIGVCTSRSCKMVVALLAVLKAGCAYVPLDPSFPADRLSYYAEDSGMRFILTETSLHSFSESLLPSATGRCVLCLEDLLMRSCEAKISLPPASMRRLAYIIYTSGSTGKPKGVMLQHGSMVNLLQSMKTVLPKMSSKDCIVGITTMCFDIHVVEVWLPLICGAKVIMVTKEHGVDGHALVQTLNRPDVTHFQATPSTFRILLECGWGKDVAEPMPMTILCGGEAFPVSLAKDLLSKVQNVYNMYGPTETTVYSTGCKLTTELIKDGICPIGAGDSVLNTTAYIVDPDTRKAVPKGSVGAIYIGGMGLARGYANKAELTEEKFVEDPFEPKLGGKMYCTGDLGRIDENGLIQCLGRIDNQVKINGYRMELGEIEGEIDGQPSIKEVAVLAKKNPAGELKLVAYVVATTKELFNQKDVMESIGKNLPSYMVPQVWVCLDALPLLPNGKVNRNGFADPDWSATSNDGDCDFVEPKSPIEEKITNKCCELLGKKIGTRHNFFTNGGNSLFAVRLFNYIAEEFPDVDIQVNHVFRNPTVEDICNCFRKEEEQCGEEKELWKNCLVPLQLEGKSTPLFFVHPAGGLVFPYFQLSTHLAPHQPFYAIQDPNVDTDDPLDKATTLEDLASLYIKALLHKRPNGPFVLGGWSVGGNIAFEMAQQLRAMNHTVPIVILVDSFFTEKYDSLKVLKDVVSGVMAGSAGNAILLKHHELKSKRAASDHNKVKTTLGTAFTGALITVAGLSKTGSVEEDEESLLWSPDSLSPEMMSNARTLYYSVKRKNRRYRMSLYKTCFVGSEAVEAMIHVGMAGSRAEAVDIGRQMVKAKVFHHCLGDHDFEDKNLFYRFFADERTKAVVSAAKQEEIQEKDTSAARLYQIANSLHNNLEIRDRRYRLKTYKRCFLGSDAVKWMMTRICFLTNNTANGVAWDLHEALDIGQRLLEMNLIHHVTHDHPFKNEALFYRFTQRSIVDMLNRTDSGTHTSSAVSDGFTEVKNAETTRLLELLEYHTKAGQKYEPKSYGGRVAYISCTKGAKDSEAQVESWTSVCHQMSVSEVDCNHYNVMTEPHCSALGVLFKSLIQEAELCIEYPP